MAKKVSRLNYIAENADKAASDALNETADFILLLIRLYVPIDTGRLRDSYQKESVTPLHILIGSALYYSIYQEFGTSVMPAQPHLAPSFIQAQGFFETVLVQKMKALTR